MKRIALLLVSTCLAAIAGPRDFLKNPDAWFGSAEGREVTKRILTWQSDRGSWPKNKDTTQAAYVGDRSRIKGTFDNGATTDELRFLARAHRVTGSDECRKAVLAAFDHILEARYSNGGWPQYFPPGKNYHRHITFNDACMVRILEFLRETATAEEFNFLEAKRRQAALDAVDCGIGCILKCQIIVRGVPTVWYAQHDEVTLAPAAARKYELPSLSGSESAGILHFLMSVENPTPEVVRAVNGGVAWFNSAKLEGIRIEKVEGDRKVIKDRSAPPLWARFYEIDTNRPFFCDRDGVTKYDLAAIGAERRNGYAWYGNWGENVAKAYAKWPHH